MEAAAGLIKLNPDSDSKVNEWRDTMKSRIDEALATLVHEGAEIESWFESKSTARIIFFGTCGLNPCRGSLRCRARSSIRSIDTIMI
jgi:hypothetical protein